MAQKKLKRFKAIKAFSNVLEYPENIAGKWSGLFKNTHPIILELACGKGEYTTGLGQLHANKNFIGVDIKGNRLWVGAKFALDNRLENVAFLRTQIEKINQYFEQDEVEEIWITFPDPQPRLSKAKKRLTHPRFLRLYQQIMKPTGKVHLKTDSEDLYYFTKKIIELYDMKIVCDLKNIYKEENMSEDLKIKTYYERLNISKSDAVFYLSFTLPGEKLENNEALNEQLKSEANSASF